MGSEHIYAYEIYILAGEEIQVLNLQDLSVWGTPVSPIFLSACAHESRQRFVHQCLG
jgi:hypothetical protein